MTEYEHKEAFALMIYMCDVCGTKEVVWNSRDGVTPFGTNCPSCGRSYTHHFFGADECAPNHKLHKYQKFWRDGTEAEARAILIRRCKDFRSQGYDMGGVDDKTFIEEVLSTGTEFPVGWPKLDICLNATGAP